MTGVLFVCLGNICRSPMAEAVFRHRVGERGLTDAFMIDSAGTGAYHTGEPADRRTRALLERYGIPYDGRARQVQKADFDRFEWILAMDRSNLARLNTLCPPARKSRLHLMLEPTTGEDVPDPYYGGPEGFELNYRQIDEAVVNWLARMV